LDFLILRQAKQPYLPPFWNCWNGASCHHRYHHATRHFCHFHLYHIVYRNPFVPILFAWGR
jgi:hypothetical protein